MGRLFKGLGFNLTGFTYFTSNRELWKFAILPFLLNLIIFAIMITGYVGYFGEIMQAGAKVVATLDIPDPQGFWAYTFDGLYWVLRALFMVLFFLLSLVMIFVATFLISQIINASFFEMMSERILVKEGVLTDVPFKFIDTFHAIKIEVFKTALFGTLSLVLLSLSLIPLVGMFFAILQLSITAWFFAFGLSSYPMVKTKKPFREILLWGLQHKLSLLGFGLPALIPFLGLFTMSFQVVGGTLLYKDTLPIPFGSSS